MNSHAVGYRFAMGLALSLTLHGIPAQAQGPNLLVDPGFENNPLESAHNVLNYFERYQGFWGPESGSIVAQVGPVIPPEGTKMLQLRPLGGVTTEVFQVTDVSDYAALIDSGKARVSLSSLFNADPGIPAAVGAVAIRFFAVPDWYSSYTIIYSPGLALDADPGTWQEAAASGVVPVGTRWMISQMHFSNDPLRGLPGYVDSAEMTITESYLCTVSGACPGAVSITWKHARPSEQQTIIYSSGLGNVPIGGMCGSALSGLASVTQYGGSPFGTLGGGEGGRTGRVNAGACGKYLQLVTFTGGPCVTSNVTRIPL